MKKLYSWSLLTILGSLSTAGCAEHDWFGKKSEPQQTAAKTETPDTANVKDAPAPRIASSTHLAAGKMLEGQGDLKGAIAQYERALASNPKDVTPYNRLGVVYHQLGQYAESERMFKRGIQLNPQSPMLRNNYGFTLLQRQLYPAAAEQFRAALEANSEYRRARMNLGITLAKMKRFPDSVAQFSHVLPRDMAHYNVGVICTDGRDYTNAEAALRKALEINPKCTPAQTQLDRVLALSHSSSPVNHTSTARTPVNVQNKTAKSPLADANDGYNGALSEP